jgi:hypothetical protein
VGGAATALTIVLAVAAVVRLAAAGRQPLWADELFSLAMATGHSLEHPPATADADRGDFLEAAGAEPPAYYSRYLDQESPPAAMARVIRAVFSDTSPPLYYLLLAAWTRLLGTSDWALRLFSVAASLACLVLFATLARRVGGRASVLPAAALLAASPMAVYYSTEGRMYALLLLWVVAALVLALHLRLRGSQPTLLAAYVLVGAAGLLTHYFFAPVWLVVSAWLLAHAGRCSRGRLVLSLVLTVALAFPWYSNLPQSLGQWRVTARWLEAVPGSRYSPLLDPLRLPLRLVSIRVADGVPRALGTLNQALLLTVAALALRRLGGRLFSPRRSLLWLTCLTAVGTPLVLDAVLGTYMSAVPRYAIIALPPALVLITVMLTSLRLRSRRLVTALVLALAMAGTWQVVRAPAREGEPLDELGEFLARKAGPTDVVVVHSIPSVVCGVARYMERSGSGADGALIASWVGQLKRRRVPGDVDDLARGRGRVLLVDIHATGDHLPPSVWLQTGARLISTHRFGNARVFAFRAQGDEPLPAGS